MTPLAAVVRSLPQAAGLAAVLGGCLVLVGWTLDVVTLKSVIPGLPTMKATTALAFITAGASLWLWAAARPRAWRRRTARLCGAATATVGLLTLVEDASGRSVGLDHLLFAASPGAGPMAEATALTFVLVGGGLLGFDVATRRGSRPAQVALLAAAVAPFSALFVYAYGAVAGYTTPPYGSMALHTVALFVLLIGAALASRVGGDSSVPVAGETPPAGATARLSPKLPALIVAIAVLSLVVANTVLYYVESRLVASTGESLALAAHDIATRLDLLLFEHDKSIRMLAQAAVVQGRDVNAVTEYLSTIQKAYPAYAWLAVTNAGGRIIAATAPESVGQDRSRAEWFTAVRDGGDVHMQDAAPSEEADGMIAVAFTAPIRNAAGGFIGAVTARVALPALEKAFADTVREVERQRGLAGRVEYQFLTRDGEVIVDSRLRQEGAVNLQRMGLLSALFIGTAQAGYVEEEHVRRRVPVVSGYAQSAGFGSFSGPHWGVLVRLDRGDILGPIRRILWTLGAAGAAVVLPLLGLLLWASKKLGVEWETARRECARAVEHYRTTMASLPVSVVRLGKGLTSRFANRAFYDLVHRHPEDSVGRPIGDVLPVKGLEEYLHAALATCAGGGTATERELECAMPTGDRRVLRLTASGISRADDDDDDDDDDIVLVIEDLTERRQAEEALRQSEAQLRQAQKMESVGRLAGGIAHELRNPLAVSFSAAQFLLDQSHDPAFQQECVQKIIDSIQRASTIIENLLRFARPSPSDRVEPLNLVVLARETVSVLTHQAKLQKIKVREDYGDPCVPISGNANLLQQVVMNLILNAYQAMPTGGEIRIAVRREAAEAVVRVRDTGCGISPAHLGRVFDPFFTTQPAGKGTGLGLSICHTIVKQHGGVIDVDSVEGQSSTFTVRLPLAAS